MKTTISAPDFTACVHACPAGSTVASNRLAEYRCARVFGGLSGAIRTSIVNDYDLVDDGTLNRGERLRQ